MARFLVVEDDPATRSFMKTALIGQGHDVTVAEDVQHGRLALISDGPFDFVLAEMVMSGAAGIELAVEICKNYPNTRMLLLATHWPDP